MQLFILASQLSSVGLVAAGVKSSVRLGLKRFTSLVVFGDSWTASGLRDYKPDANGNVWEATSTGGRVWPQYVEQYAGVNSYDYAVSGAVSDRDYQIGTRNSVKQNQIPTFLSNKVYRNSTTNELILDVPNSETAYAIWIGTNDLGNRVFLTEKQPKGLPVTDYQDCVYGRLDRIYENGGQNFGVETSLFFEDKLQYNPNITQTSEEMRAYVYLANTVFEYRTPYEMSDIWHNPSKYLNGTLPLNVTSFVTACGKACDSNDARDSYMWYDELHPSEQTDRVVAEEFIKVVNGTSRFASYFNS
ncbi:Acetylesterase [Paramyrothecium foliicola]|nr:Acetylesterase [Paramyrothecium foliicola]